MLIGVDLDSVLAYLEDPLFRFHNDRFGTKDKIKDAKDYDMWLLWKCTPRESFDRICDFYRSPYMDEVLPVKGAIKGIAKIKQKHELVVITSRPNWIEEKTNNWINMYFPGVFKQVIQTNQFSHASEKKVKKSEVCLNIGAKVFIDDCPAYCEDCAGAGISVYMFARPWNKKAPLGENVARVSGWGEIEKRLLSPGN